MQLHMRGVELVVELMEASEQVGSLNPDEMKRLLREAADVLADLLKRDIRLIGMRFSRYPLKRSLLSVVGFNLSPSRDAFLLERRPTRRSAR